MIGSGEIIYTTPLASARSLPGGEAAPTAIGSLSKHTLTAHPATGNRIEGFKWDERVWPNETNENYLGSVPANLDPSTDLDEAFFLSGIGNGDDLKYLETEDVPSSGLRANVLDSWIPEINHGYYYDQKEEYYLYSDDSEVSYLTYSGIATTGVSDFDNITASGFNQIVLDGIPKPTIPILVSDYIWDTEEGRYDKNTSLRKVVQFSGYRDADNVRSGTYDTLTETRFWTNIDKAETEFVLSRVDETFTLICNKQYVEEKTSEIVGITTGSPNETFHSTYSPIDSSLSVEVVTYITEGVNEVTWETIDPNTTISGQQVRIDYDFGILEFGDSSIGFEEVPQPGSIVELRSYWKTMRVEYEPINSTDTLVCSETDLNPIHRYNSNGFLYLKRREDLPASIRLTTNLDIISPNVYGPIYIGNSYGSIVATVKDSSGAVLEDQSVTFEISNTPIIGTFGGLGSSVKGVTNEEGKAYAFYLPPGNLNDLGQVIPSGQMTVISNPIEPTLLGIDEATRFRVSDFSVSSNLDSIFLYKVFTDDALQGWRDPAYADTDEAQTSGVYTTFFTEEGITGETATIDWEGDHRTAWNLTKPAIYGTGGTGRKELMAVASGIYYNPHTLVSGAVGPFQPVLVKQVGNDYDVYYNTSEFSIPTTSGQHFAYFLVAPTVVKMKASVYDHVQNRRLTSNEITVNVDIPPYMSGLWTIDALNQTNFDEINHLLASGLVSIGDKIPLGFRLRSSNVTLAAALGGVTFLDVNPQYNYNPFNPDEIDNNSIGFKVEVIV